VPENEQAGWAKRRLRLPAGFNERRRYAGPRAGLVPVEKEVTRAGKQHHQIFWVSELAAKKLKDQGRARDPRPGAITKEIEDRAATKFPIPAARKWRETAGTPPTWTKYMDKDPYKDSSARVTDQARARLHKNIKAEFLDHVDPVPADKRPRAILMMGGTASGKSSMTRGVDKSEFVHVDSDEVKSKLPEFLTGIDHTGHQGVSTRDAAFKVHAESSYLGRAIRDAAIAQRKNMLVDGTGRNAEEYLGLIRRLKADGYHVTVLGADLDVNLAVERAAKRAEQTGRSVAEKDIREIHKYVPASMARVMREADSADIMNTTEKDPVSVWSWRGGKETVHNAGLYAEFQARTRRAEEP
jgi:predicted ABC-type ATPase